MLRNLATNQKIKREEEDEKIEEKLENKFKLPESSILNEHDQIETIDNNLNVEPENADEKLKLYEPYVEPTWETPVEIETLETNKPKDRDEISEIMNKGENGVDEIKTEEKIDKTIDNIIEGDRNNVDGKIEDIFIDNNKIFENDDMTDEDKEFIRSLINKTNFFPETRNDVDDIDFTIHEVNVDPPSEKENEDDVMHVKTVPTPSTERPIHPRERLRQEIQKVRKRKERYRKMTKKRLFRF